MGNTDVEVEKKKKSITGTPFDDEQTVLSPAEEAESEPRRPRSI
jgi:hypothetical protein